MAHLLQYAFVEFLLLIFKFLPCRAIAAMGRGFGLLIYYLGVRRKIIMTNLRLAFKDQYSEKELKAICREVFANTGSNAFEFLMLDKIPPEKLGNLITMDGDGGLKEALKEGKGALLAGTHFGNWELLSAGINHFIMPFCGYAGLQHNPFFDDKINELRRKFGMDAVPKSKNATVAMYKKLQQNVPVGIMCDINVPRDNLFVQFFGIETVIGQGIPAYVVKGERPLFFIWIERVGPYQHVGHIERLHYTLTGDEAQDMRMIGQICTNRLEENIRKMPGQFFWFNRRFKTRPKEERGVKLYHKMD